MLTPDEVRYVVQDSGTRAVVASADKGEPLLDLRGSGNLQDVVLWGEEVPPGAAAFADWLADGRPEFSPVRRGRWRPGGYLLHVRDDRPSEGLRCNRTAP